MNRDKKIVLAAELWRKTEREVIANKADGEKQREHYHAKMQLREAIDTKSHEGAPT
jgi:hypothetical protein